MARLAAVDVGSDPANGSPIGSRAVLGFGTAARWGIALFFVATVVNAAQGYPQLRVVALSQHADRATVEPGGVFNLTIHVKITQRRDRLDELILGSFENCEIISNETVRTVAPDGTDFVERLTVQALAPGEATISPAYIDATDPTLGKPMRFSSNAVRVHVAGAVPDAGVWRTLVADARRLLLAAAIVAGLFAAAFVLIVLFVRRRRKPIAGVPPAPRRAPAAPVRAPAVPGIVPSPPVPAAPTSERLVRAAEAYRSDRSDPALAQVRAILFGLAGVPGGATLVDALRALDDRNGPLRAALLAAERAAFGPAAERAGAGDEMLAAIQAYAGGHAANA